MSYCVNCGVELDKSAKKCALCNTPVYNPIQPVKEEKTPFSKSEHIPAASNHRFVAYMISVALLIPNIVCFLSNAVFRENGFWALYINATSFLLWVLFVFPFFTKKLRPYLMWFVDTLGCCFYVYFFFVLGYEKETSGWYYTCALPIMLTTSFMILLYMFWLKSKKRHWVLKSVGLLIGSAITALVSGAVINYATKLEHAFDIGLIIFVSCAIAIAFLIYCYKSKYMKRWLEKNFFV